jgi:hypothetical protein
VRMTRVARLERFVRERPCPGCGRLYHPPKATHATPSDRLSADELVELAELMATAATPECPRCGHVGFDIGRLTDDQKRRTLALLRILTDSPLARSST